jgi:hypothetical protein
MELKPDELEQLKNGELIRQKLDEITKLITGTGATVEKLPSSYFSMDFKEEMKLWFDISLSLPLEKP